MKETEKKKPIRTIPSGVWESSRPKNNTENDKNNNTTDLQQNGYPVKTNKQ